MIVIHCDICMKIINPEKGGLHLCEKHRPFAEQFYRDQMQAVGKAIEVHRNRFLQNVVNRPRPISEAVNK